MKSFLVLSENREFKKELTSLVGQSHEKGQINYVTVSNRANAIAELSQKEFHAVVIDCTLLKNDLNLVLKYLSTNDYYFCHIFFLSEDFSVFEEVIKQINFPHLNLLSLPINVSNLAKNISTALFPPDTQAIDQNVKINLDFLKIFIDSSKKVLNEFCHLEKINHQRPYLKTKENQITYGVIGKIPLKSQNFDGVFTIAFTKEIYLELINKVLMLEATEVNEDILDFAGELVNMTYGQAKFILNDIGYNFVKIIPSYELNPVYVPNHKHHIVVVPLETEIGIIYIEVDVFKIQGMQFD